MSSALCNPLAAATPAPRARAAASKAARVNAPAAAALAPRRRPTLCAASSVDVGSDWPANWALASFEDVGEYFNTKLLKAATRPDMPLADIMSTTLKTTTPDTSLEEAAKLFDTVTGVPVVASKGSKTLVGVLSRKDVVGKDRATGATVADAMSSPPIAARASAKVADAAGLMLKHKVHRIPVVNSRAELIGIVTRTDIFTAMLAATPGEGN